MKRTLFSIISAGIISILTLGNANAQMALNKSGNVNKSFKAEKSFPESEVSTATRVDFRTLKDFRKRFYLVDNVSWYATDKGYIAEFSADSIKTTAAYSKKGYWFYTVQRYGEKKLPADIKARVKREYYDYTIMNIAEIQVPQQDGTIYILNLQYNQNTKIVRVFGDDMKVMADFHS